MPPLVPSCYKPLMPANAAAFDDAALANLAERLAATLLAQHAMLATAESCTGGWIAKVLTDIAGSSVWFERGFVSYSNEAKQELLGVSANTLRQYGAVSAATVAAMATGALRHSRATYSVAVSGVAGPGGGGPEKPVGTVWIGWASKSDPQANIAARCVRFLFPGDREQVRRATVAAALQGLLDQFDVTPLDATNS